MIRGSIDLKAIASFDEADAASRDVGDIPPPLPREIGTVGVLPMHDSDPGVREHARAAINEKAA